MAVGRLFGRWMDAANAAYVVAFKCCPPLVLLQHQTYDLHDWRLALATTGNKFVFDAASIESL